MKKELTFMSISLVENPPDKNCIIIDKKKQGKKNNFRPIKRVKSPCDNCSEYGKKSEGGRPICFGCENMKE